MSAVAPGADAAKALTWPGLLGQLLAGTDLAADDTAWVMDRVLSGEATAAQLASSLDARAPFSTGGSTRAE